MLRAAVLGCALLAGCGQYPTTDGFRTLLPQRQERLMVWSTNATAAATASTWLQKQGLAVTDPMRMPDGFTALPVTPAKSPVEDAQMLRLAQTMGLHYLVYVDVSAVEAGKLHPPFQPSLATYMAAVSVRGIRVETGEVVWSGTARYRDAVTERDDYVVNLTCQALATAWGLRPSGEHPVPSQAMCTVGDRGEPDPP